MANSGKIGGVTFTDGEMVSPGVGNKALKSTAVDGTSLNVDGESGYLEIKDAGTSKSNGVQRDQMSKFAGFVIKGNLVASDAAAGIFSEENTYGTDLLVLRIVIFVSTASTGACTIDVGEGNSASTSYDNIIDGLDVSSTGASDNLGDPGSNGHTVRAWRSGEYLNASMATGATAGLVGTYAIHCIDIN
jgi:hypothetical protein